MVSIAKTEKENQLLELVDHHIGPQGFRAVDVDVHIATSSVVRVFIERLQVPAESAGFGSATIDDCEKVSRLLSPVLDVEDLVSGRYNLEVSSPGMDRRLRTESDFRQAVSQEIKLRLHDKQEGVGANPRGILVEVLEKSLKIEISGTVHEIPFKSIRRANLIWDPALAEVGK